MLNLSADGAVSQPKALRGQSKGFDLCAEGLNSNIHCSSGGKIGLGYRGGIAVPMEKCTRNSNGMAYACKQCWMDFMQISGENLQP